MSIAVDTGGGAEFGRAAARCAVYNSPEAAAAEGCSSSSIGGNSDASVVDEGSEGGDDGEVQSQLKGPLESVDSLEDALPMRRGISKFYSGKSKSFTSLADTSSLSAKDIAKPENAYSRKRKNLLAFDMMYGTQGNKLRSVEGSQSKRPAYFNCYTLTSSITGASKTNSSGGKEEPCSAQLLPPRYPRGVSVAVKTAMATPLSFSPPMKHFSAFRSFSLTDLPGVVISNTSNHPRGGQLGNV